MTISHSLFILYVADQKKSTDFYRALLKMEPSLDVPGMTEFTLSESCKLGLMPNNGIAKILGNHTPDPQSGRGIPRCEMYWTVSDVNSFFQHAISLQTKIIAAPAAMDWGHRVCYLSDLDGHIIAFAQPIQQVNYL
jgi:catechol 2,3-dioxygenase-like lactoylglutathione lyase family enzyme